MIDGRDVRKLTNGTPEAGVPFAGTSTENVRAVERAIELLFRLAAHREGAGLQQLAQEVNCSKSTVHRLLATLERLEVVERDHQTRGYRLGPRMRRLAGDRWATVDLRQIAQPYLQSLRDVSEETVTLHVLDDCFHVVVDQVESRQEIRRVMAVGQRIPLSIGATAKAVLAFMPPDEVERILRPMRTAELQGPGEKELEDIRTLGYALSLGERVPGGLAISAPILDGAERVCGAVSISGPSFRFTAARATRCAPALLRAAERISLALGASPRALGRSERDDVIT
jgi:DNA-binding IclR family transcriptional regulator